MNIICLVENCDNKYYAKGYCQRHYYRWHKYGDPSVDNRKKHGCYKHPIYKVWYEMKGRCYNTNHVSYKNYGSRGITICDEWKNSAKTFIEWAMPLWKKGLEINRINNNENYYPENCEFVTPKENNDNRRLLQKNNTSGYRGVAF